MSKKKIPDFKTDAEEAAFWEIHDSTDYVDWDNAKKVSFSALKPTTRSISLRLPESVIHDLKIMANKRDVPYQSLIKTVLFDFIQNEERV